MTAADARPAYSEQDAVDATAMLAAVFGSLGLADGRGGTVAFQVDPSTEASLAENAARAAGLDVAHLPVSRDAEAAAAFMAAHTPRLVVCRPADFAWLSKFAFRAGAGWVFTLGSDGTGSLLDRAVRLRPSSGGKDPRQSTR